MVGIDPNINLNNVFTLRLIFSCITGNDVEFINLIIILSILF